MFLILSQMPFQHWLYLNWFSCNLYCAVTLCYWSPSHSLRMTASHRFDCRQKMFFVIVNPLLRLTIIIQRHPYFTNCSLVLRETRIYIISTSLIQILSSGPLLLLWKRFNHVEGDMGGSKHCNTAKKINEHHITARKVDETPSPQHVFLAPWFIHLHLK